MCKILSSGRDFYLKYDDGGILDAGEAEKIDFRLTLAGLDPPLFGANQAE
jgi:hypothetical protein